MAVLEIAGVEELLPAASPAWAFGLAEAAGTRIEPQASTAAAARPARRAGKEASNEAPYWEGGERRRAIGPALGQTLPGAVWRELGPPLAGAPRNAHQARPKGAPRRARNGAGQWGYAWP